MDDVARDIRSPGAGETRPQGRSVAAAGRSAAAGPRQTAGSRILADLRRRIHAMQLAPGAPLNEKELTQVYGVSRTPIREALIRLAEEGLVEIFPQSGTFVGRIPRGGLAEAVVVRMALEGAAVAHAITAAREADLARIAAIIGRQRDHLAQNNQDAFHAEDEAFHAALADAAGHPGLWRIAQQAKVQIDRCRRLTLPVPGRMQTVIDEHEAIVAALRRRDLAAASAAMERHLSAVIPDAADISQSYPEYFL